MELEAALKKYDKTGMAELGTWMYPGWICWESLEFVTEELPFK